MNDKAAAYTTYEIVDKADKIAGWLKKPAALRTIDILTWQKARKINGSLLEIGVFCGKYFSLLVASALDNDEKALGIDTFQYAPQARITAELKKLFGEAGAERYTLWARNSSTVGAQEIRAAIGKPRFISVDGAHDYANVYRDLLLCDEVLSPAGIVAVDDFLNPLAIGVNQAVNQFLTTPRKLVPVAYIANKLFLAHCSIESEYRAAITDMLAAGDDPASEKFRERSDLGRHHIEQDFYGHKVILG
jgi:hypothetical protein